MQYSNYKEERFRLEQEYANKLQELNNLYKEYAKYKEGDIILYNTYKCNIAYKYDKGHTLHLGVVSSVQLDTCTTDDIRYVIRFLDIIKADLSSEPYLSTGETTCTLSEKDIVVKIGEISEGYIKLIKKFNEYK